jgi:uncharacterized membrane protein (UPF0182 family)
LLFRRNILDRITHITPFLKLDQDPYVVSTTDGLFWIQDAYTTADNYPLAPAVDGGFNYIRNAVKIVVDAYHGKVTYYVSDQHGPHHQRLSSHVSRRFRPLTEMPACP